MTITTRTAGLLLAATSTCVAAIVVVGAGSATATPGPSPVYRMYNTNNEHLFTIDQHEDIALLGNSIWRNEKPSFAAFSASAGNCPIGTIAVYRLVNAATGQHFLTADLNEIKVLTTKPQTFYGDGSYGDFTDLAHIDIGLCAYATQVAGTVPVWRLFNSVSGEHLWTTDSNEVKALNGHANWHIEIGNNGVAFYAYPA